MEECRRTGIPVLGPDINESGVKFTVNKKGEVRFALSAIKGVGEAAVEEIIANRQKNGHYQSLFDLSKRINLRSVNKKVLESLAKAGAFDGFENIHRAQYLYENAEGSLLEKAIKFGNSYQSSMLTAANSLFSDTVSADIKEPDIPKCNEWTLVEKLQHERDVVGIFISGHPLDTYRAEISSLCNCSLGELEKFKGKEVTIGCMVTDVQHRETKNGKPYGRFMLEGFDSNYELALFGEDYINFRNYFDVGHFLFLKGKYTTGWKSDQYELKLNQVMLLSSLRDNIKKIALHVSLDQINEVLINKLEMLCKQHSGNISVVVKVTDAVNKQQIGFYSKKYKLAADKQVYQALDSMGIEFRLSDR